MSAQKVDLYQPIVAARPGAPPLALRIGVQASVEHMAGGVLQGVTKIETYVLLSALPTDLQERIKVAVQALLAGG